MATALETPSGFRLAAPQASRHTKRASRSVDLGPYLSSLICSCLAYKSLIRYMFSTDNLTSILYTCLVNLSSKIVQSGIIVPVFVKISKKFIFNLTKW